MRRRKPYLVLGEAPARDPNRRHLECALAFRAAGVGTGLEALTQLRAHHRDVFEFAMHADARNLLSYWPGPAGRGSAFPIAEGRVAAEELRGSLHLTTYRLILACGRRVAAAMGLYTEAFFQPFIAKLETEWPIDVVVVPHPSGASSWWDIRPNRERCRAYLAELGRRAQEDINWRLNI